MPFLKKHLWEQLWRHPGYLVWILAAYLPFLGLMSIPLAGDQKVYLSTSLEMMQSHSWLKPILFGEASYFKPPLQYWVTIAGWKIFGLSLWGALVPSALCVAATAWLLGEIAALLQVRRLVISSGLWFAACLGTATYGTTAQMEIYVCAFFAASWWAGLKFLSKPHGQRQRAWLYLAFGLAGVSALVRSPLYLVLWVMSYLSYLIVQGEWEMFLGRHLYRAWMLGVGVGVGWFAWMLVADRERFWSDFVLRESWENAGGSRDSLGSLWLALLYFCFPFTPLVFAAVRVLWSGRQRLSQAFWFLACWSWPPALLFSLYPYRMKPYLFVLVPSLALALDLSFTRGSRGKFFYAMTRSSGTLYLMVLALLAAVIWRAGLASIWVVLGFALAGAAGFFAAWKGWMRALAFCALAGVFFFRAASVSLGETDIAGLRQAVAAHPESAVALFDDSRNLWLENGLLSAGIGKPVARLKNVDEAVAWLRRGEMLALSDSQAPVLAERLRRALQPLSLQELPWQRLKARTRFPYKDLILQGKDAVPDFESSTQREFKIYRVER